VTVSIGVASLGPEARTTEAPVRCADEALRHAKSQGRNRVVVRTAMDPPSPASVS